MRGRSSWVRYTTPTERRARAEAASHLLEEDSPGLEQVDELRGLALDAGVAPRGRGQRLKKVSREPAACLPVLEANNAARVAITLDQAGGRVLDLDEIRVPALEAKPRDIRIPVVVTIHHLNAIPTARRL